MTAAICINDDLHEEYREEVYKVPHTNDPNVLAAFLEEREERMITRAKEDGLDILAIESKCISKRRYKRKVAKLKKKLSK